MAFPSVRSYANVDPITSLTIPPFGHLFRAPLANQGPSRGNWQYSFFLTGTSTPQNVYQDGNLTIPFSPTGVVTSDPFGRFPAIYLDNSITYKVQLIDISSNVQQTRDPYNPAMATTGFAQVAAAIGLVINAQGEITMTEANAGGSGIELSLTSVSGGSALKIQGNSPGTPIIVADGTVTTGAQVATFAATNMPGTGFQSLLVLTAAPSGATYTGGTLNAVFTGITSSAYTIVLSTGQVILNATLTNGSTTLTTPSTNILGSPTVNITATFSTGVAGWLPLRCDGVIYYTPLFNASGFTPYRFIGASYQGQTIIATTVALNGDGTVTVTGAGASASPPNYYQPPQTGIGTTTFLGITKTGGLSGLNFMYPVTATAAPSGGAYVGGNLTANFGGTTSSGYSIILSTGQLITGCTFTNGAVAFTTPSTAIQGTPNATLNVVAQSGTLFENVTASGITISENAAAQLTGTYQLSTSLTGTPVVATGTITLSGGNGATGNSWNGAPNLVLADNGTATLNGAGAGAWSSPTAAGQGANYWINITRTGGTSGVNFSAAQGAWTNITSGGLTIGLTGSVAGNNAIGTYQISNNSAGTAVVANGNVTLTVASGPTGNSWSGNATLVLNSNGTVTLGGSSSTNWYAPTTSSVGALYWINITKTGGTQNFTAGQGAWTNITNSGLTIDLSNVVGNFTTTGTYQISPSASGSPVVANGNISLTKNVGALNHIYTNSSGTETIPVGATTVVIETWAAGGGGAGRSGSVCFGTSGPGGGGGSYSRSSYAVSALGGVGKTFNYTNGVGGGGVIANGGGPGGTGGNSTVTAGSVTGFSAMTAHGGIGAPGVGAGAGGAGGSASSGGNQANTAGNAGQASVGSNQDNHPGGAGITGNVSGDGSPYGGGGTGTPLNGIAGSNGAVVFHYT